MGDILFSNLSVRCGLTLRHDGQTRSHAIRDTETPCVGLVIGA
jgi:hypothetical protein